jgi:hypothetical protein
LRLEALLTRPFEPAFSATTPAGRSVVLTTAEMTAGSARETIEHCKAPLLILVETFVKRLCHITQFLQCCSGFRHGGCASTKPLDGIIARSCIAHGHPSLDPLFREIARRLFERRPIPRLIGRQHKAGKKTALRDSALAAAATNPEILPLEFLLGIMRDPNASSELRFKAAQTTSGRLLAVTRSHSQRQQGAALNFGLARPQIDQI